MYNETFFLFCSTFIRSYCRTLFRIVTHAYADYTLYLSGKFSAFLLLVLFGFEKSKKRDSNTANETHKNQNQLLLINFLPFRLFSYECGKIITRRRKIKNKRIKCLEITNEVTWSR